MSEIDPAKSHELMFVDLSRAHFHSPSSMMSVCGVVSRRREGMLVWSVTRERVRNTSRGGEFRSDRH